jgi:hypothetical protein
MEVKRYEALEALPNEYGLLFREAEKESFFNSEVWYRALISTATDPQDKVHLYGVEDDGRPMLLLLAMSSQPSRGPLATRLLRGCQNVYTIQFSPLVSPDCRDPKRAIREAVGALVDDRPRWDAVSFAMIDRSSQVFEHLLTAFRQCGMVTEPYFQYGNWYEDIGGRSFEGYLGARGKSVTKTIAWKARRFLRQPGARFQIFTGAEDFEEALAGYNKVYDTSWKEPEQYPGFIERLMRDCAESGTLRLGNLYLQGEPVATWFIIVSHGTATGFKTAYDPTIPSNLSVGGVLTYEVIRHLITHEKVSRIDFGIGDEHYKSQWLSSRRERWGILACNRRTSRGALFGLLAKGRSLGRNWLKQSGIRDGRTSSSDAGEPQQP